ncbi:hypothetical protein BH10CHL1_BH10CHL1_51310 [soil metagenome]
MNQPIIPSDETTHSFVIRLWQETPGQWRGAVRHVQSESRLAFTRLDQAMRWIERSIEIEPPTVESTRPRRAAPGWRAWWANLPRFEHAPAWAMVGVLAMLILMIVLTKQNMPGSLAGTAAASGGGLGALPPFLIGLVIGGVAVAMWTYSKNSRR